MEVMDISTDGALVLFDITDAAIAELASRYMGLTIQGIDDKQGLDAVHRARIDVKTRRVSVQKSGKAHREKANAYLKIVLTEEKRVLSLLEPIEDHLSEEENRVVEEVARIKAAAEAAIAAKITGRQNLLFKMGCVWDGTTFSYAGVEIAEKNKVAQASDEQFAELVQVIQSALDEAAEEKAEAARKQAEVEAELKRVASEQAAEKARLELVAKQQREEQERLNRAREEEAARNEQLRKNAEKELAAAQEQIRIEKEALEAEKKRLVDAEANRLKAIEDEKVRIEQEKIRAIEIETAKQEAAAKAIADAEAKAKKDAEAKAAKEEAARLKAERKVARQPDKVKILAFVNTTNASVLAPDVKSDEGKEIVGMFIIGLGSLLNEMAEKAEAL
jgi:hypothetical protein